MKLIKAISFMMIFIAFAVGNVTAQSMLSGVTWVDGFSEGIRLASFQKKKVVVFFENSSPNAISVSLIRNTFTDPQITELIKGNYIAVRSRNERNINSQFNIIRYPTLLVLDSTGTKDLGRVSGIISTERVINLLQSPIDADKRKKEEKEEKKKKEQVATVNQSNGQAQQYQNQAYQQYPIQQRRVDDLYRPTFDRSRLDFQSDIRSYNGGRFEYIGEGNWIHLTSFYTVAYKEFNEDQLYYYLENDTETKFVALPKTKGTIWIWGDGAWRSIERAKVSADGGLRSPPSQELRQGFPTYDSAGRDEQYNPQRSSRPIVVEY